MRSSLGSTATAQVVHRRNQVVGDGWGGDAQETLTTLDDDLYCRIEWAEGVEPRWDFWIFDESADVRVDDVLINEQRNLGVLVERVSAWRDLKGVFHHYEVVGAEHPLSTTELLQ
jgi:hypothetical protein